MVCTSSDNNPCLTDGATFADAVNNGFSSMLAALSAKEVARLLLTGRHAQSGFKEHWPAIVIKRNFPRWWPLQKVNQAEAAMFYDPLDSPQLWQRGPNKKVLKRQADSATEVWEGNVLESDISGTWLTLSGGTDWQAFQGGLRTVSNTGARPSWVSFRVQISRPAYNGAFIVLAAGTHTWGLEDVVFMFQYRGDEGAKNKRCFALQTTPSQKGGKPAICEQAQPVISDRPYDIAINLDWAKGTLSLFIDGVRQLSGEVFDVTAPVRYVAVYNWRAAAQTSLSELVLGSALPYMASTGGPPAAVPRRCKYCHCLTRLGARDRGWPFAVAALVALTGIIVAVLPLATKSL
jgi:hypothetical protein